MEFWFLFLLLLGAATYLMVQLSVAQITRTPVWLLWLVLMTPSLLLSGWTLIYGVKPPPPSSLIIWPSIICLILYWLLFQWGRQVPRDSSPTTENTKSPLPTDSLPETLPVRPIEQAEETLIRNCFPWSVYYIQNIEYRPQAVICRGQLRTTPDQAYQQIKTNIESKFGDRFVVIFQEGVNGKPLFVIVPNSQAAKTRSELEQVNQPKLAILLLLATLITTTLVGAKIAGADLSKLGFNLNTISKGLPYSLGLISILGVHELGHYLTARFYKIRVTLPYFIPIPFFFGTIGAFIQMRSPIPNRKALFDMSIASYNCRFSDYFTNPVLGLISFSISTFE